ncbi:MAG: hypothetical protein LBT50_07975 [Prevotellaceae bacterium]|nr:hypothetical protein [Prevotellaceae bacterium]
MDKFEKNDDRRLEISIGIIALSVALWALGCHPENDIIVMIQVLLTISAVPAFIFLILTSTKLKHKKPNTIGNIVVSDKFRKWCYDTSIHVFSVGTISEMLTGWFLKYFHNAAKMIFIVVVSIVVVLFVTFLVIIKIYRNKKQ